MLSRELVDYQSLTWRRPPVFHIMDIMLNRVPTSYPHNVLITSGLYVSPYRKKSLLRINELRDRTPNVLIINKQFFQEVIAKPKKSRIFTE